jgi:hypothetical protein
MSQELAQLINGKNDPCISLIIPLHREPAFRKEDAIQVGHTLDKLQKLLEAKYEARTVDALMVRLRALREDISSIRGAQGAGVFVSPSLFSIIEFPFPVKEKIQVGRNFEIRDVVFNEFYFRDYFVLSLNKDRARLFRGNAGQLAEVNDNNFPALFDGVEYQVPVESNQAENTAFAQQREKGLTTGSSAEFYNTIDVKLLDYIDEETPIVLAGSKKEVAQFDAAHKHRRQQAGVVHGSFDDYNHADLEEKSWQVIEAFSRAEEERWVASVRELFGRELVAAGVQQAWRNARMGKGNVLVVERELSMPGFASADGLYLWLRPPVDEHTVISDAVDDVIETVLEKGGRIVFVQKGALAEFEGIALVNRY